MEDETLLEKIATRCTNDVVEIGPGKGALTKYLLKKGNVLAVEKDPAMIDILQHIFSNQIQQGTLQLLQHDILEISLQDLSNFSTTLFSNLPYSISEPFFYKILKSEFKQIYLVTGKNFYDALISQNKLGLYCKKFFKIELLGTISPNSFNPPPKTESVLFSLCRKPLSFEARVLIQYDKKGKNALLHVLQEQNKTQKESKELLKKMVETNKHKERISTILDKKIMHMSNIQFDIFWNIIHKLKSEIN